MNEHKISKNLLKVIDKLHALDMREIPVIVERTETEYIEGAFSLVPMVAMKLSVDEIYYYSETQAVKYIWLDEKVHTCLHESVPQIAVPYVWDQGATGFDMTICIVDTGVDILHPGLHVIERTDFTGEGPNDTNGHGTHCAGIAAGFGDYEGVAPDADILSAKVLDRDGSGYWSDVMAGVEWAVDQGAEVISLSLGSDSPSDGQDPLSQMCNAAAEYCVVCVAAGNSGPGYQTIGSPGAAEKVITVGSVDKRNVLSRFSSWGPTLDGRTKPDICMPGQDIVSCRASGTSMGTPVNSLYTRASGTSMATPHMAGLAALLLEAGAYPRDVKDIIKKTALDLQLEEYAVGAGRARADAAYNYVIGEPDPPVPEPGCWEILKDFMRV